MARPKKTATLDEEITRQEEVVTRSKAKYDADVKKLKDLYAKRDERKKKALLHSAQAGGHGGPVSAATRPRLNGHLISGQIWVQLPQCSAS